MRAQRFRAVLLSVLMISLAQTAYISSLQGWAYPLADATSPMKSAGCDTATLGANDPMHVDGLNGDDSWAGTTACPKATIVSAVENSSSGDEVIVHEGLYHENITIDNKDDFILRAATGERVVLDGTRSITGDLGGVWGAADSDGIQDVTLTQDGWQLFLAYEEQVPARWPNAQFSDETVFNRSYWAEGTLTGSNNAYTKGWLTDAGPEAGVHTGLNETVNATGLDPVGAIAVMNLGSFRSNSRIITDWNPNNGTFAYDGDGVGWKTKHHAYFLEGKRELIDQDGEWWYNTTDDRLHYKTPSGQDANDLDLRVKVQPFAISVDGSDSVTIQGIDFFGTTVNFNNCDGCSFTNATLEYPSTSKRGLGIAGESEDDRWMTRFYRSKHSFVDNISITNTDGGAIEFQGSPGQSHNNTVNNSYFHAIDWSAADQKGLMVTIYEGGRDMYFTNNTVHLTGASSVLSIGDAPKVFYNEVWDVGYLQTDGAVVQVMQAEAPGAEIAYNWIHDIIKYGARFDAPIGQAGEGRNGTMHHNVIWNAAGGLMVKGDYHDINNNTVFNSSGKNDMIILTDNGVNNENSTIHQNAADKMADHRSDSWSLHPLPSGTYWNNWNGYVNTTDTVWNQLVDPANRDFRPKANSHLDNMSAGAYDADDSDPWAAGVSWTYSPMSDPISGCMDSIAINYNSNAVFSDGSCVYTTLASSSSTLSLEVGVSMTPHTLTYSTPFLADDTQTAASSGAVGMGANIALDANGAVHICSKIESTDDLYYTTNASGSWQSATVDSGGNVGGDCFIILDSDDDIHITYRDDTNNNLKYATKALSSAIASSNWAISTMDNNGNVGNFGSMVVDANDTLHVAYYSANGASLKYATLADGSTTWSREVVESTNDVGKYTSIALDSNGKPHITYFDDTNNALRYTHKMGSSWTFTTLDSTAHTGKGTSLAIDSNDHLHVAYKTNSTEIAYMTNRSGSWVKTTLDANSTGSWGVNYINIMLDEGDDPHVVYSDMVDYDIFYMSNTRGTWERILVAGDSISKSSEAVMDENGGIHVAYHINGSFDDVGYAAVRSLAHRPVFEISPDLPQGLSLGAENGTVFGTPMEHLDLTEFTVWANTTRTSAYTTFSMNVDWELQASVDWMKAPRNTAITPITFNWTAWSSGVVNSTTAVANTGNNGNYNSIVADSNDKVHIVYYREDNANLMYSTNASGSWQTTTVESSNNVGKYCNLAIDGNDGLHISYQYNSGNALKYAYKSASSSSWTKTTVDNTGGKFTSIATDSNNNPHIAYRDSGGDVGYATKSSGGSWTYGTVQSAGDIAYTSIVVDADDHIHIAYYDANNKDMYHFTNTSGSWARTFLEDIGTNTGGTALDIAIDPTTDEPGISYFDMDATSLKYTYYTGSAWSATTVESGADYGRFNSIVYDSVGNVHISHERNSADDLYYTSDKTGSWVSTALDTVNSVGTHTSIAVDSNDDLHIAYRHNSFTRTMHATVQGYMISSGERANVSGATCSISPSLPFGLSLNQGTCTISGTPTSHGFNTTYNVTATSSTGVSKSGEFKLWITQVAPSIAYAGSPFTFTVGTAISSITPTNTGDSAFWSVSPSLPSGLSLGAGGVISGTPSVEASAANYTITASNPGGESSATVAITVNAQAPSGLSYATENMTLSKGVAMTANTASVGGGTVSSWQIFPSLPTGLALDGTTGSISGTPTVLQTTAVTYTIWANNSGGSASAQVNITINDVAPSISYSNNDITGTKGVAISPSIGPTTSGGTITSWEISPSPGSAFTFNSANGEISGTPSIVLSRTQYTIWANNSGGSSVAYVNVTINDVAPNTIVYSSHDLILEKGTAMTTTTPAISGGSVTSWEISPSIPNGLSFSSTTGAISGTPSILQTTSVTYTIWANNSGGSTSTQMNITINDQVASVSYPSTVEVSNDRNMTTVTPTNTGGAVTSWVIVPSLPSGLNFGSSNGSIWGTPTGLLANATYTVYANNSGGSSSTTFTLGLNWTLTPSAEGAYITRNSSIGSDITFQYYNASRASFVYANTKTSAGQSHTCAILDNGDLKCWGRDNYGQLGDGGSNADINAPSSTAINLGTGRTAVALSSGSSHTCAILDNGAVSCWGRGAQGQLGHGGTTDKTTPTLTSSLGTGRTAVALSSGAYHTCAILDNGAVSCWGAGGLGRLGHGGTSTKTTPTLTSSLGTGRTAVALSSGGYHTCAILDNGAVSCWGLGTYGQLGHGGTSNKNSPTLTSSLGTGRTAVALSSGNDHTCAILDNGAVSCWGRGSYGQLGNGGTSNKNSPTLTSSLGTGRTAVALSSGYSHTCAILDNGAVSCWGAGGLGRLGHGGTSTKTTPTLTSSLGTGRTAVALSSGIVHTCAILDNGSAMCWGGDGHGQLGDGGSNTDQTSPVLVSGSNTWNSSTGLSSGSGSGMTNVTGATCAISPSLPTGMSLTSGTCTITGTPTVTAVNATYTVWANFSGTSYSGQIYLEVGLNAPIPSYAPASYTYTKGTTVSTVLASNTGGEVTTWGINATLPSGLSFGTSNGSIWGTPDTVTASTTYTVWANNSAGSGSTTITLTINDVAPVISYSTTEITGTKDVAISPHVGPTTSGGIITSWEISPDPGSAFHFNTGNGYISGTPSILLSRTQYTIWANNSGGSSVAYVNVTINDQLPTLSYSPENLKLTKGQTSTDLPLNATLTGSGTITSWAINASLPSGVSFGTNNGTIYGTPTELWPQTSYMVWANNSGGSSVAYLNITVETDLANISYDPSSVTVTRGYDIAPITANNAGAEVLSWAISPALPSGLSFENGTVYGRPLVNMTATAFTVYANNSGGSATATLTLTVNEPTPNVDYSPDNYTLTNGTSYTITPSLLGQTGPIQSIITNGSVSSSACAVPFGDLFLYGTKDHAMWAFNTTLPESSTNPYLLATDITFTCVATLSDSVEHNGTFYFQASTNATGNELWKTDGSFSGTNLVKDIRAGTQNSDPRGFFVHNETVHFYAQTSYTSTYLWETDGTASGTTTFTYSSGTLAFDQHWTEYNGSFYARMEFSSAGREVAKFDGSTVSLLVDLTPGMNFGVPKMTNPHSFTVHDGWLWFLGADCLYRSNGTASGTTALVCDAGAGLVVFKDELYFGRNADNKGLELWKTDGTVSGTSLVVDTWVGTNGGLVGSSFIPTDELLYFEAKTGTANADRGLWVTDGTTAGSRLLRDGLWANLHGSVVFEDVVYFSPYDFSSGSSTYVSGLWSTDGTTNGTVQYMGYGEDTQAAYPWPSNVNGILYFRYYTGTVYTFGLMHNASGAIVGQPSSWSISPSLPAGLNFGSNNGTIWGTPTALNSTAQYTITATNANGSSTTTINITVVDDVPVLSYTPASVELTNNTAHPDFPLLATVTGSGVITSWAINDSGLPTGVIFSTTNGTFWGTPTQLWPETTYTVWANNSGGSTSATVTISVIDQVPTLAYSPSSVEMTNNTANSDFPLAPSLGGPGDITSWAINDSALPTGVFFGTTNGTFWGVPTQLWPARTYTVWANNSGGSTSATVTLEVVDQVPVLSYSPDAVDMVNNTAHADFPLAATLTGPGEVLGWVLNNSALPSGVFFGTTNGTFWGTPTELWPETTYTIWANNSGGSTSATVTISVVDQVPVLSYSPNTIELRNNTVHNSMPLEAILTGPGEITSWAVNDSALPTGLFFGATNGTFWGTPTQLWPVTSYTVWANNSGGSASATVTISVVDQIPTLAYVPSVLVLVNNTAHADMPLHAVLTGPGEITSWALNDSVLPTGLNFGTTNGTFWGTPTALWPSTAYTVWANNSGGSVTATVTFSVIDQLPTFAATLSTFQFTNNTTSPDLPFTPVLNGPGTITEWGMSGTLPAGLFFEPSNATLWGVPTQLWPNTGYTIYANNSGGTSTLSLTLEIVDQLPALSYVPATLDLVNNTAHADLPLEATLTGPGEITSWVLVGALPEGLSFGTTNGTVWGIATELWPATTYTVWANNSGGSSSATLVISVVDELPTVSYVPDVVVLTNNTAHADLPLHAVLTGPGEVTSWALVGELPEGLTFEASNGTVWGVATELWPETTYTVWANNSGGSSSATLTITVIDQLPTIAYVPDVLDLVKHTPHAELPLAPVVTGPGLITSWAIDQALPFGVQFSTENGTFWGTPTELWPARTYTVWANNSGGSATATVTISVVDQVPTLSYTPEHLTLVVMESSNDLPLVATLDRPGDITSWALSEALPQGLFFSTTNGTVYGMAEEVWSNRTYTVWANNSGGSTSATFSLEVISQTPRLLYAENLVLIAGDAMPSWQPFVQYGSVDTWAIEPDLPDGLVFSDVLGRITGTPTTPAEAMTWTVWTNATGVAVPWNLTITVLLDTDDDGMPDALPEGYLGALIEDLDDDNDGLLDVFETNTGVFLGPDDIGTNPLVVDTDADTWDDAEEVSCGADPTNASDVPVDTDGDGLCDALEADPDGDGYSTQEELACSSDPMNATSIPVDIDGDGACDALLQPELSYTNVSDTSTGVILLGHPARFDAVVLDAALEAWTIEPALPKGLVFNATDGSITGVVQDSDAERPSSTHTVFATEVGYGRIIEVEVTFTYAKDSDGDGMPDALPEGYLGALIEDLDDDNDGWNDTIEAACGSNPLDASSYPSADFTLVDGACVDASAKPLPPVDEGPELFTLCMLFWVAVILLALVHRKNERREHQKNIAAEKDEAISEMIANDKATEEE